MAVSIVTFCYPVSRTLFRLRKKRLHKNQITLDSDAHGLDPSFRNIVKGPYHYMMLGGAGDDTLISISGFHRNTANNRLFGGDGNDKLLAGGDHDQLFGGNGNDFLLATTSNNGDTLLSGGFGADRFAFSALTQGIDTITDFRQSQGDKIEINQVGFGATSKDQFNFDASTGALSFNDQHFATLQNSPVNSFSINSDIVFA